MVRLTKLGVPSEDAEQRCLIKWLESVHPGVLYFAIPNGGWRDRVTASKLKATGVKAGVPDLFFPEPRGGVPGLFIEMKRARGGGLSPFQKEWLAALQANGYKAEVCRGAESAMAVIDSYLSLKGGVPSCD